MSAIGYSRSFNRDEISRIFPGIRPAALNGFYSLFIRGSGTCPRDEVISELARLAMNYVEVQWTGGGWSQQFIDRLAKCQTDCGNATFTAYPVEGSGFKMVSRSGAPDSGAK